MVYFGERRFQRPHGASHRDRRRLILLGILLVGTVLVYALTTRSNGKKDDLPAVSIAGTKTTPAPSTGDPGAGSDGTAGDGPAVIDPKVIEVVPLDESQLHDPPEEFVENPARLMASIDGGDADNPRSQSGRDYLFHRWRTEQPVPVETEPFPSRDQALDMFLGPYRGKRYKLTVRSEDFPSPVKFEAGPSGVRQYWEFWARDNDWLYRILFLEKDAEFLFEDGSEWEVVADFHRIHEYAPRGTIIDKRTGQRVTSIRVPEFIALRPRSLGMGFVVREQTWSPLIVVGVIGLIGVLILLPWALKAPPERPRFKMGNSRGDG